MAKQRRAKLRPASRASQKRARPAPKLAVPVVGVRTPPPSPPLPRAGYHDAVALYEQGVAALQAHEYSRASTFLRSVLSGYPDEKELHERARLYLNVCERQVASRADDVPKTPEQRLFAATVAFNAEDYGEAEKHLLEAVKSDPDNDHALYMLAAVLALESRVGEAVPHLLRAMELNPENRAMARHDPDVESLRDVGSIRAALDAPAAPHTDRRRPLRRR